MAYRRFWRRRSWGGFRKSYRSFRRRGVKFLSFKGFKTYALLLVKLAIVALVILFIYRLIKSKGHFGSALKSMPGAKKSTAKVGK